MDFTCEQCHITIRDAAALGTSPDGVFGRSVRGTTGHVIAGPDRHYALTVLHDTMANPQAYLRFIIQRDLRSNGDTSEAKIDHSPLCIGGDKGPCNCGKEEPVSPPMDTAVASQFMTVTATATPTISKMMFSLIVETGSDSARLLCGGIGSVRVRFEHPDPRAAGMYTPVSSEITSSGATLVHFEWREPLPVGDGSGRPTSAGRITGGSGA